MILHGVLGSARNVRTLARRLAGRDPRLAVLALDLPGHGSAPPLGSAPDTQTLARDVLDRVRALGLAPPLVVVGHSLGGRVALRMAARAPDAVAHVTLLDVTPSPLSPGGETARVFAALAAAPATAASREPFRAHFRAAGLAPGLVDWLLLNLERGDGGFRWRIDRAALADLHRRIAGEDLWPTVERARRWSLHCIRGGVSPYVGPEDVNRLEAAGCRVDTVAGAGHFLHAEQPDEVAALVLDGVR